MSRQPALLQHAVALPCGLNQLLGGDVRFLSGGEGTLGALDFLHRLFEILPLGHALANEGEHRLAVLLPVSYTHLTLPTQA